MKQEEARDFIDDAVLEGLLHLTEHDMIPTKLELDRFIRSLGYRLVPELELLTDEAIKLALKPVYHEGSAPKRYARQGDINTTNITWAYQVADAIAKAQLAKSKKEIEEGR